MVARRRRGNVRLGCILLTVIAGALIYYGSRIGAMYWRYYEYEDAFKQQARFAAHHTDGEIGRTLQQMADTLSLPDGAHHIYVKRKEHHILIWNEYYDHVDLPFYTRDFYFNPQAEFDF
jgi:hypothetical protein